MNNSVLIFIFQLKRLIPSCNFHLKRNASDELIRLFIDNFNLNIRLYGGQIHSNHYLAVLRLCAILRFRRRFRFRLQSNHLRNSGRLRIGNCYQSAFTDYADILDFRSHFRKGIHLFGDAPRVEKNRSRHDRRRQNKNAERRYNAVHRTHFGEEITDTVKEAVALFVIFLVVRIVVFHFIIFIIYLIILVILVISVLFFPVIPLIILFCIVSVVVFVICIIPVFFFVISVVFLFFRVIQVILFLIISVVVFLFHVIPVIPGIALVIRFFSGTGRRLLFPVRGNHLIIQTEKFHRIIAYHARFSYRRIIVYLPFLTFFHYVNLSYFYNLPIL